jgi:glycosyltransferase involved in cell wall biosynthesis
MKIAFITNICPHYRIKTFETISQYHDIDFYFFSAGDEWYWQKSHGKFEGNFNSQYLKGFNILGTRITPTLAFKLITNDYDVIIKCITGRFTLPITFIISKLINKPFILWTGIWMRLDTPFHKIIFPITKYIYNHADSIVVYGEHVKKYLLHEGVKSERVFSTTHAVDNEFYNNPVPGLAQKKFRKKIGVSDNEKIILYLGRLEVSKGLNFLIEAVSLLNRNDIALILAGDGSEKQQISLLIEKLRISNQVRLPGYISTQNTLPYYAISYVFVLPSITTPKGKEPWGLVINEAFNQGIPVITTDAVGAAAGGLVEDGINGFIVPERNSQALSEALNQLLDNPNLRNQMGQNAKNKISNWNNENMVKGFLNAIDYVTKNKINDK